jgi:hypothetical protein
LNGAKLNLIGPRQRAMLARLGNVLYWAGCIFAAIIVGLGIYVFWIAEGQVRSNGVPVLIGFLVVAIAVWAIGRACRYVLSGT